MKYMILTYASQQEYRAAQLRILATLTLADNFDDPSTWFTVARALG